MTKLRHLVAMLLGLASLFACQGPVTAPPTPQVLRAGLSDDAPAIEQAPSWVNLNLALNTIANEQNVEVGSWPWLLGGVAAFSGQSGEHASYGWLHTHKVNAAYVRAVLANYGHRRTYYHNAPFRDFGYYNGGRPKGWAPEIPGDLKDGTAAYVTSTGVVIVSGPEAEHFWLEPLFAVMDSPPVQVQAFGQQFSSVVIARVMATLQVRSLIGAIRNPATGKPYSWTYGGRADSRILDTFLQAYKHQCLEPEDAQTGLDFITGVLLPFYESSPGISEFNNGLAPAGTFSVGCFNGLYWLLPVFYDAAQIIPDPAIAGRFMAIVRRYSQWAYDLETTVPGRGFNMAQFFVDRVAFTAGAKPLDTIKPLLSPSRIRFDGLTWEVWATRACAVAAKVTGAPELQAALNQLMARHLGDPKNKQWMVGADRKYL